MLIRRLSLAAHRAAASREGSTAGPPPVDGRSAWRSHGALAAILCLLVLAQLALTATYALRFNVWVDEAYTLHTTSAGLAEAVRRALAFEMQPPAYFAVLAVWRRFGVGIFFVRLLSMSCAALAIPAAAWASVRYFPRLHPAWLAAAVGFSPAALWSAAEARPYALDLLLSVVLLGCFQAGFLAPEPSRRYRAAYAAVSLLALYTQYYLGFLIAGNAVALAAVRGFSALGRYLAWMVPVVAGMAPLIGLVPDQVTSHTATSQPVPFGRSLAMPLVNLEMLAFGFERLPGGRAARWLVRSLALALLLDAGRRAVLERRRIGPDARALAVTLLVAGASFAAVSVAFGHWAVLARHTIGLLPPALLLLLGALAGRRSLRLAALVAALLAASVAVQTAELRTMAKQGDHLRAAREIRERESPGQPILIFPSEQALAFAHHYHGINRIVPLPEPASLERYDPTTFAWRSRQQVRAVLDDALGDARECWLITQGAERILDYPVHPELLESEVAERFATLSTSSLHGDTTLRLLRRLDAP